MASSITLIAVFSIALFGCITEARKNPTDFLQSAVINEHTEDNHHAEPSPSNQKKTTNGNTLKDFESKRGSHLFYHGDDASPLVKDFESKLGSLLLYHYGAEEKPLRKDSLFGAPLRKDFESKLGSLLLYHYGAEEKPLRKDFESKLGSLLLYHYGAEEKTLMKDFESKRGSHLFYHGDDAKPMKDN
ncbi:uncharacterized protein [Coffea arabica]|uniref:Uncharacterized protein n=1 Tax=Coffea arabica TaxID=13443 RepID=A0A6P6SGZ8_COFAR|nr:uncharacterized protein LOC113691416 [Coffea arabica]XP_027065408.1 uncharacterized protein LOC113691465 [Coffea arabica]